MLRPKHRLEMADARDCDQEARENRITNQVPAVALESLGLRFWHRKCHAAAFGRSTACSEQTRVVVIKKLERIATRIRFLLSH